MMVRLATPLARGLARSSLCSALSAFYGDSKELTKHSLSEAAKKNTPFGQCEAVLAYLMAELVELAGNAAYYKDRRTIKVSDVLLAIREDGELSRLEKYA
jgi:histone H3/H4